MHEANEKGQQMGIVVFFLPTLCTVNDSEKKYFDNCRYGLKKVHIAPQKKMWKIPDFWAYKIGNVIRMFCWNVFSVYIGVSAQNQSVI